MAGPTRATQPQNNSAAGEGQKLYVPPGKPAAAPMGERFKLTPTTKKTQCSASTPIVAIGGAAKRVPISATGKQAASDAAKSSTAGTKKRNSDAIALEVVAEAESTIGAKGQQIDAAATESGPVRKQRRKQLYKKSMNKAFIKLLPAKRKERLQWIKSITRSWNLPAEEWKDLPSAPPLSLDNRGGEARDPKDWNSPLLAAVSDLAALTKGGYDGAHKTLAAVMARQTGPTDPQELNATVVREAIEIYSGPVPAQQRTVTSPVLSAKQVGRQPARETSKTQTSPVVQHEASASQQEPTPAPSPTLSSKSLPQIKTEFSTSVPYLTTYSLSAMDRDIKISELQMQILRLQYEKRLEEERLRMSGTSLQTPIAVV